MKFRNRLVAFVPIAALALAACSESTGPGSNAEPLDPVSANQQAQSITTSLEQNPALPSLEMLETTAPILGGSAAGQLFLSTAPFSPGANGEGLSERLQRFARTAQPYLSSAEPAVIIPADLLGKTLVYNPNTGEYEVDETLTDAPANGVRVMLYARDPVFERPIGDAVGYADFMDVSTPSADALQIIVVLYDVNGGSPVIDYTASASVEVLGGVTVVFRAVGSINDGLGRSLTFDLNQSISEEERIELDYDLTAEDNGVTIHFEAMAGPTLDGVTFSLSVSNGSEALVLSFTVNEAGINGLLDLPNTTNDISITVVGEEWVIEHTEGGEITEDEAQAIRQMFQLLERIEHVVRKLMRPAHRILNVPLFAID